MNERIVENLLFPKFLEKETLNYQYGEDRFGRGISIFSADMSERYFLARIFENKNREVKNEVNEPKIINFLMLNPSKANSIRLDPTVTRCTKRALNLGYDMIVVSNLYPLVSTDPKLLKKNKGNLRLNFKIIEEIVKFSSVDILAYGNYKDNFQYNEIIKEIFKNQDKTAFCLEVNSDNSPAHPLYLRDNSEIKEYFFN